MSGRTSHCRGVLCLVLAVRFAALTWILRAARDDADQPVNETAPAAHAGPPIEDDPQRLFRRPTLN